MARFKTLDTSAKSHQGYHRRDHNHSVHTGSLPIASSQVKPHSKLVKGQGHRYSINNRLNFRFQTNRTPKNAIGRHSRKQKNTVIQMMDMSLAQKQITVGNHLRHDEKNISPSDKESDNKTK